MKKLRAEVFWGVRLSISGRDKNFSPIVKSGEGSPTLQSLASRSGAFVYGRKDKRTNPKNFSS